MIDKNTFSEEVWQAELEVRADKAAAEFKAFVKTVAQLRHPVSGCPWDLEQNHESLRRYMIEEAYEAAETMLGDSASSELLDELGDVLLQVVLNSQLSVEKGQGDIEDVVKGIREKMIRRHPHVFAPTDTPISSQEVSEAWVSIKQKEKPKGHVEFTFAKAKKVHPALTQAYQIGKIAKKIDFDWKTPHEVFNQLQSELKELLHEIQIDDKAKIAEELSDCFFSLAQLSRHLGLEPEDVAHRGNLKFLRRFDVMEELAKARGADISKLGQAKLEELWIEAKQKRNSKIKK